MKKIHIKITIVFIAFLLLLSVEETLAASGYQYENVAFYAQSNSSGYKYEGDAFYAFDTQITNSVPVFRFVNSATSDHFYTTSESEKNALINNPQWGYKYEGDAFYAFDTQITNSVPVFRFVNSATSDHFYTTSESEKNNLSISPVYRFVNINTGDHFYTIADTEKNTIINNPQGGYRYEGVAFNASRTELVNMPPVYRFLNPTSGDHLYTASTDEKNSLTTNPQWGYIFEGIAFYAFNTQMADSLPVYRFYNSNNRKHFYTASESEKNYLIIPTLGSDISVGLWNYTKADIQATAFKLQANKSYNIKNKNGSVIAQVAGGTITRVTYDANGNLKIYDSIADTLSNTEVSFDAADGNNTDMVFDVYRPNSTFDQYRGKIKVRYTDSNNIWVINTLPLEHYVWGDGELAGTGPLEHTKAMTMTYRTYGYWKIKYATTYAAYGFKVRSDSGSQVYSGYDWEIAHPNIRKAAEGTRGVVATYANEAILAPYSSWTDGRTRSYQERWGSTSYPWCQSVSDSYGNYNDSYWGNASQTTTQLEDAGNHMVGLSAHGSLRLAGDGYNWNYDRILKYYYQGINLVPTY